MSSGPFGSLGTHGEKENWRGKVGQIERPHMLSKKIRLRLGAMEAY